MLIITYLLAFWAGGVTGLIFMSIGVVAARQRQHDIDDDTWLENFWDKEPQPDN